MIKIVYIFLNRFCDASNNNITSAERSVNALLSIRSVPIVLLGTYLSHIRKSCTYYCVSDVVSLYAGSTF